MLTFGTRHAHKAKTEEVTALIGGEMFAFWSVTHGFSEKLYINRNLSPVLSDSHAFRANLKKGQPVLDDFRRF